MSVSEEARALPAVREAAVPLRIEPFVEPEPAFNRQDDIPPYWGGACWIGFGKCSTASRSGWGVGSTSTINMLSAGRSARVTAADRCWR